MVGRRITTLAFLFLAAVSRPLVGQTQDLAALRQGIAQADGRAIITLKSSRGAAVRAPGSPPIAPDEMNSLQARIQTDYPVQVQSQLPIIGALVARVADGDVARLAADPNVAAIEPDWKTFLIASAPVSAGRPARLRSDAMPTVSRAESIPWGVSDVNAPAAWAAGINGAGTKIGIMDTGIDYTHPDLNVVGGYDFTTSSSAPSAYSDNQSSCDGHGTHVAGIAAAKQNGIGVVGVAPAAALYSLKVFIDYGAGCMAYGSAQIAALQWAVTNHLDVVSISIGNTYSLAYANAILSTTAAGVVVVAAAGNSGAPGVTFPAAYPGTIAVAALDPGNTVAGYSSSGPEVWVAAPGSSITSTLPGGGYGDKSGTSMATPHVSGLVALIRQLHPSWTVDQIRNELKNDALNVGVAGFDNNSGWGVVQAPPTGVVPVTIAIAPTSRHASAQQGSAAPADNAAITLSGTNAATTAWTATKKKAWLTLTTASGTGSGTVAWTRNTTGLAVGTYVDTVTVSTAVTAAVTVFDTLTITAVPTILAVSPSSRSATVQLGNSAPGDNATVTLSGGNAATTAWTATKKKAWLTLTTASGTGSGTVAWTRNSTGLAVGTYVDTITVSAAGAVGSPSTVYDTLKITAVPTVLAVSPAARSVTVAQGSSAPADNATVTLSGGNAATTAWTATKKKAWLTLTTASGTGSGAVAWTRNSAGLAVGTYVDTITVTTAVTGPATVFDTLKISAVAVVLAVSPSARSVSVQQGGTAPGDNATVTLTGSNASTTAWTASHHQGWLTLTTAAGTGSGVVAWNRSALGLAVGTYVDTITVTTAVTGPSTLFDTLTVTAAPIPLVVAVSPSARAVSVQQGTAAPGDNASVSLTGNNASSTVWTATKRKAWLTLTTASGTGSGTVAWTRNTTGLAAGTYVDTISVSAAGAAGSPALLFDSLKITAAPPPLTMTVAPAARSISVTQGTQGSGDNFLVTLSGANAATTAWTSSHTVASWEAFVGTAGTGTGYISWNRNVTTLPAGIYVDTITVSAAGALGSPAVVFDTVKVTAVITPVTLAVSPVGRSVNVQQGTAAPSDNAAITLSGTNAATTAWTATNHQPWLTLTTASGTGSGVVAWSRSTAGLAVGTYVDTIRVATAVTPAATIIDTLKITALPVPIVLAVNPTGRHATVQQGNAAPADAVALSLTGTGSATTAWTATRKHSWLTLASPSGIGSASLGWTRSIVGLAVGTYVDTITVATAVTAPATVYDTLTVTAAPVPIVVALSPGGRSTTVQQGVAAASSNATVTLTGTNATTTAWAATNSRSWLTLTTPSGTGSGSLAWNHNASGLAVGIYVDTITVAAGASAPARLVDTLKVTAADIPVVMAVSPASRSLSVPAGQPGWGDNAQVTFTGTDAATTTWSATHSLAPWAAFISTSGTGNGYVTWNRNIATLVPGTYVDTITVRINGSAQALQVLDSVRITPVAAGSIAVNPAGRKVRSLTFSGSSSLLSADVDSAVVMPSDVDSLNAAGWNAVASSSRLVLSTSSGPMSGYVRWSRPAMIMAPGMYVDTVVVSLVRDASVRGQFVDSLEVVAVTVPEPDAAVSDLFGHVTLSDDQRLALDRQGNNNGRYDLGDFLAWVNRNQIRLSSEVVAKLRQASALPVSKP